jgi:hypothetical protein
LPGWLIGTCATDEKKKEERESEPTLLDSKVHGVKEFSLNDYRVFRRLTRPNSHRSE